MSIYGLDLRKNMFFPNIDACLAKVLGILCITFFIVNRNSKKN